MVEVSVGLMKDYIVFNCPSKEGCFVTCYISPRGSLEKTLEDAAKKLRLRGIQDVSFAGLTNESLGVNPLNDEEISLFNRVYYET